jgi:hypothetical protein
MRETFTNSELVKYLYREGDVLEMLEIEAAAEESSGLRRRLSRFRKAKRLIPQVLFTPSNRCLNNILQYSTEAFIHAR